MTTKTYKIALVDSEGNIIDIPPFDCNRAGGNYDKENVFTSLQYAEKHPCFIEGELAVVECKTRYKIVNNKNKKLPTLKKKKKSIKKLNILEE